MAGLFDGQDRVPLGEPDGAPKKTDQETAVPAKVPP